MTHIIKFFQGYLVVTLTGTSPERFLNLCRNLDIVLWSLRPVEGGFTFCVTRRAFPRMEPLYRKTGTKITVQKEIGIPFLVRRYRNHFFFPIGIVCAGIVLFAMSQFIWKVEINGNSYYSTQVLLEGLREEGVGYATAKKDINCKELQTALRKKYTDITWVSAKIEGTKLYIDLQERLNGAEDTANNGTDGAMLSVSEQTDASEQSGTSEQTDGLLPSVETSGEAKISDSAVDTDDPQAATGTTVDTNIAMDSDTFQTQMDASKTTNDTAIEADTPCSLIASSDGTVESITTRTGTPLVEAGNEVKAGDILVSGAIEVRDDSGETASVNYVHADADVVLYTTLAYEDSFPVSEEQKVLTGKRKVGWIVEVGGRYLNLLPLGEEEDSVVTMTVVPVVIGEDFYLPFQMIRQEVFFYEVESRILSETEISARVEANLEKYCENLIENGIQIMSNSVMIERNGKNVFATGNLEALVEQKKYADIFENDADESGENADESIESVDGKIDRQSI